jgi:hypothetical protein
VCSVVAKIFHTKKWISLSHIWNTVYIYKGAVILKV